MTYQPKSDFLRVMSERGFMKDCTDLERLDAVMQGGGVPAYIGFDCTASSLHVGSLLQIMMLRWLQKTGQKPIVLMGGGTTKVGDPSGKDESRKLLDNEAIAANKRGIFSVFEKYMDFGDGPTDAVMMDNAEWLDQLNYITFLREYGPHFTINRMLSFDSVRLRLDREQPLTFLEFNYMLLQAYDFVELYRRAGCRLQLGGSDQWGNIINGMELGRRVEGAELFGITTPLIATAAGAKMGKSADGAIWLNADMRSPYEFWQFWRNTMDADVGRFLRLFTELPLDEVARLEALEGQEINDAKKVLATEVTTLCHGAEAASKCEGAAKLIFEAGVAADEAPKIEITTDDIGNEHTYMEILRKSNSKKSGKELKRLAASGGIQIGTIKINDLNKKIKNVSSLIEEINDPIAKIGKETYALSLSKQIQDSFESIIQNPSITGILNDTAKKQEAFEKSPIGYLLRTLDNQKKQDALNDILNLSNQIEKMKSFKMLDDDDAEES